MRRAKALAPRCKLAGEGAGRGRSGSSIAPDTLPGALAPLAHLGKLLISGKFRSILKYSVCDLFSVASGIRRHLAKCAKSLFDISELRLVPFRG